MDALKAVGLCALLASPPQAAQPCGPVVQIFSASIDRWQTLIAAASQRFGVPAEWIRAVMARESMGLTTLHGVPITSRAGAMGLMQLMPDTWRDMRARYGFGNDPFDARDNIFAGTAYLREMFDRYGYPDLFAAYHAGPGRFDAVLRGDKQLPETTKTYLESIVPGAETDVISSRNHLLATPQSDSDILFFVRGDGENQSASTTDHAPDARGLFVPLAAPSDSGIR